MIIALTGTPGTGKTTLAKSLAAFGFEVKHLSSIMEDSGILQDYDEAADCYLVDTEELRTMRFRSEGDLIVEGHLSHLIDCDMVVVLRCNPRTLADRLSSRGYSKDKIQENADAEALDAILIESLEANPQVFELDTTYSNVEDLTQSVIGIISGDRDRHLPGRIGWLEEL